MESRIVKESQCSKIWHRLQEHSRIFTLLNDIVNDKTAVANIGNVRVTRDREKRQKLKNILPVLLIILNLVGKHWFHI